MVFAAILLAQRPGAVQLLGGLLILAGITVVQRGAASRKVVPGPSAPSAEPVVPDPLPR